MNAAKTLSAQLLDFPPWTTFARYAAQYDGDRRTKTLTCAGLHLHPSLVSLPQILWVTLFEKMPLVQGLPTREVKPNDCDAFKQLNLSGFYPGNNEEELSHGN